jgi:hypothetical protein
MPICAAVESTNLAAIFNTNRAAYRLPISTAKRPAFRISVETSN